MGNTPEAYEKLLLDLINKQSTLFTRWDEIETSWKIIDEIKAAKHDLFIYDNFKQLKEKINEGNEEALYDL
jgi:glucose-6-phosphate 1-dehydrogenase